MDKNFWQQRWTNNEIGFHLSNANPLLVKYLKELSVKPEERIFIPLCGKTLDIAWLLSQGFKVVGAEIVEVAVEQLFAELGITPIITHAEKLKRYSGHNLEIYVGDIFNLTSDLLGHVDAVYDRAALVALPVEMRSNYTQHLRLITKNAKQLLITFVYDQSLTHGPPFSIDEQEVKAHYTQNYNISLLQSADLPGGLRGKFFAKEEVWSLMP